MSWWNHSQETSRPPGEMQTPQLMFQVLETPSPNLPKNFLWFHRNPQSSPYSFWLSSVSWKFSLLRKSIHSSLLLFSPNKAWWSLVPPPHPTSSWDSLYSLIFDFFFASTHLLPPRATCPPGERLNCTLSSSFVLWGYKLETPQVVWGNLGVKGLCQRLTKSWKENVYHVPTTCATLLDLSICIHFSWGVLIQGPERYWGYLLRGLEVCATHLYIETNPPHDLAWGSIRSYE